MNKREFLDILAKGMSGLPEEEKNERIVFYEEMIEDCMEDGSSEEEAVSKIGNPEEVLQQIFTEIPLSKLVKNKVAPKKKKMKAWEVVLIVFGSPIWLSLGIILFAVALIFFLCLWLLVMLCYVVMLSIGALSVYALIQSAIGLFSGRLLIALFMLGGGVLLSGLAILAAIGSIALTKVMFRVTKKIILRTKMRLFV